MTWRTLLILIPMIVALNACKTNPQVAADDYTAEPLTVSDILDDEPMREPRSKYGNPTSYSVLGKTYVTLDQADNFVQRGEASFYGTKFHGRRTSSGEIYDMNKMTAAHKKLPLPSYVEVTNLKNGKKVVVKVNDRGPFHRGRIIDLSYAAAAKLGITRQGTGQVEIKVIDPNRRSDDMPAMAAAPTQAWDNDGLLFVQAGAFAKRENAERRRRTLPEDWADKAVVRTGQGAGKELFKIYIGPLQTLAQADAVSAQLKQQGIDDARTVSN